MPNADEQTYWRGGRISDAWKMLWSVGSESGCVLHTQLEKETADLVVRRSGCPGTEALSFFHYFLYLSMSGLTGSRAQCYGFELSSFVCLCSRSLDVSLSPGWTVSRRNLAAQMWSVCVEEEGCACLPWEKASFLNTHTEHYRPPSHSVLHAIDL